VCDRGSPSWWAAAHHPRLPPALHDVCAAKDKNNGRRGRVPARAASRRPVWDQVIKVPVTLIHLGIADSLDHVIGQFAGGEDLPAAAFEAMLFIGRDHDHPITTVAGDDHGLSQSHVLTAANFLAELSRGHADHVSRSYLPDNPVYPPPIGNPIRGRRSRPPTLRVWNRPRLIRLTRALYAPQQRIESGIHLSNRKCRSRPARLPHAANPAHQTRSVGAWHCPSVPW